MQTRTVLKRAPSSTAYVSSHVKANKGGADKYMSRKHNPNDNEDHATVKQ